MLQNISIIFLYSCYIPVNVLRKLLCYVLFFPINFCPTNLLFGSPPTTHMTIYMINIDFYNTTHISTVQLSTINFYDKTIIVSDIRTQGRSKNQITACDFYYSVFSFFIIRIPLGSRFIIKIKHIPDNKIIPVK